MQLSDEEWQVVLTDQATLYHLEDFGAAVVDPPPGPHPVLVAQAQHLETGVNLRLAIHIPVEFVPAIASVFAAMTDDLRQRGAL